MLTLPITFALSLTESGWILIKLSEEGDCMNTVHCTSNEEILSVLSVELEGYRNSIEKQNSKYYLEKPKPIIPILSEDMLTRSNKMINPSISQLFEDISVSTPSSEYPSKKSRNKDQASPDFCKNLAKPNHRKKKK